MVQESGAPPLPSAETPVPVEVDSRNLTVDESQRYSRKDAFNYADGAKDGQWPTQSARYLSPSPAPSGRLSPGPPHVPLSQLEGHQVAQPKQSKLKQFWIRNKGPILVAISQLFGALMNLSARLLELEKDGMHPVQVLLLRQALTSCCCLVYMWWMSTPGAPFGGKEIRLLLLVRGCAGFFGIYGLVLPDPSCHLHHGCILTSSLGCGIP